MADGIEPRAMGNPMPDPEGIQPRGGLRGMGQRASSRASVSSQVDVSLPKVDALSKSIDSLLKKMSQLRDTMLSFSTKSAGTKMAQQIDAAARAGSGFGAGAGHVPFGGAQPNAWQQYGRSLADTVRIPIPEAVAGPGGRGGGGGTMAPPLPGTGAGSADVGASASIGAGVGNVVGNLGGSNGPMAFIGSALMGMPQVYGSLAGGGLQYVYNRINGPGGNMNSMLQAAQALGPNVTMMNAATPGGFGGGQGIQTAIQGLAQRMPIMGTQQDMLQTIQAGQSVGALMSGTPNRSGFFESARQMQLLNPGQSPGTISGSLAGYMGNVQSQQRGAFLGQGAFTMVGAGGRYKTLAEWAAGITKFFEQQRPGGGQGKSFTSEELIAQNFPGSNINAWFEMMGVPQNMVDYWWQYVLTTASAGATGGPVTTDTLGKMVSSTRGMNLGQEQLRTATQSTRRDFLMGNQMYSMYGANAAANRRFNVAMQGTDQGIAQQLQGTNLGRMIALLPTPILEMLMPILTQFVSSPVGGLTAMGAMGGLFGGLGLSKSDAAFGGGGGANKSSGGGGFGSDLSNIIGGTLKNPLSPNGAAQLATGVIGGAGDIFSAITGDPVGDVGSQSTAGLDPSLAARVNAMMRANPNLRVSSGLRDSSTQGRMQRNGQTGVGAGRSMHTRGWAADIGPVSQMGWLQQNASKFGLSTASNYGEPWHVQRSGTPMVGDPAQDIGNSAIGAVNNIAGFIQNPWSAITGAVGDMAKGFITAIQQLMSSIMEPMMRPIQSMIQSFIGSGGFNDMIGSATSMFSSIVTSPLAALANVFGKATGNEDFLSLINQPATMKVPVMGSGFTSTPAGTPTVGQIFTGDPMPVGDPYMGGGGRVVISAPITIQAGAGSGIDIQKLASQLATHLENEVNKKSWLVS